MRETGRQRSNGQNEKASLYQEVTDKIIVELEQRRVPWVQPWSGTKAGLSLPKNAATGRRYSAVMNRSAWRQSRRSSQMLRVIPETAIFVRWTIDDESHRATAGGILMGRVKDGSDCESNRPTRWVC